jgi:tripartite-type tricarboxylate transporter receptor subunit TctC
MDKPLPHLKCCAVVAAWIATTACPSATAQPVAADAYPTRPVTLLVGYGPGGSTDIVARVVAQRLSERWGVQAIVVNRPGADTIIATEAVAKAQPDGYTLLVANSTNATNASMHAKLPYDPLGDFTSVAMLGAAVNLLSSNPAFPPSNIKELIALAKARPGEITYASVGAGSSQHLLIEHFAQRAGINLTHVPYKSGGAAIFDTIAGHITTTISAIASQSPYVKAGKLKPLVVTSTKRSALLPQVATIGEQGFPELQSDYWIAIMGPSKLPPPIIAKLNADINAVLQLPTLRERFVDLGVDVIGGSSDDLDRYYRKELTMWANVVRDARIERK